MDSSIKVTSRGYGNYPQEFEGLNDPPAQLWWRGTLPARRRIAIVGSRAASPRALVIAQSLAEELSASEFTVVSGGALGIDGAAHRGALAGGSPTVAVLGCGIDRIYPEQHRSLFQEMLDRGGALLSSFAPGTEPKQWHFPARNALIAAWSEAVIVVEAQAKSGSLYTAREARKLGRTVYALPGSPGTDWLIRRGAASVERAESLPWLARAQLRTPKRAVSSRQPPPEELQGIWQRVAQAPKDVGEIARELDIDVVHCASVLLDLELEGWVKRVGGGRYVRVEGVT